MKRILLSVVMLVFAVTVSAQSIARVGFYMVGGEAVYANPQSSVTVSITVEKSHFVPGEFARYAQKMLGVRASLAERSESRILSASICDGVSATEAVKSTTIPVAASVLPAYRRDNRALSVEQQAQAAADLIFSMRRVRKELITGDAGENVFGAGLRAALEQIAAEEQQCLDLFYGTTTTTVEEYRYTITPTGAEKNYIVCRYREGAGLLPVSDLSGAPVMLVFTPEPVELSSLPIAGDKDKVKQQFVVAAQCGVELLFGTETLASTNVEVYQYGQRVALAVK